MHRAHAGECEFDWSAVRRELGVIEGGPLNIGWHCSDRICQIGNAGKPALVWEDATHAQKRYSFDELRRNSNAAAALLMQHDIRAGDRVCLLLDRIPDLYFCFLGALKLGAIVQPLFSAFGVDALQVRLEDAETKMVITQAKYLGKLRHISAALPSLRTIVAIDARDAVALCEKEVVGGDWRSLAHEREVVRATRSDTPSVLHYTSGTTGRPKGVLHTHASLLAQYLTAKVVLDLRDADRFWCTADPGWVTGTSYGIIGPWCLGVTQYMYHGGFSAEAWYGFIERHKISVWYTAPTAIRMLMKAGDEPRGKHDLSSLRHLASVGEPLNAEAVLWSKQALGLAFHDTYWQTETGAIVIANVPGMAIKPGSMGKPVPGIAATVLDEHTLQPITTARSTGLIGLKPAYPSLMREYWRRDDAYQKKFANGWYLSGDRAWVDDEGYFWFVGRDDDIINTAGHLVSPFEVESALLEHPAVAESAAVSKPDTVNMEVVKAYVVLQHGYEASVDLELELINFARKKLASFAAPQQVQFVDTLPKTRSGKIMRRLLRAHEWGIECGDTSTLEQE